ncbi:metallophosphoesterase family protein [Ereboglobus luteus]|uniref:Calcineurin-like phosphoesterase domain-containing protein n=1 Tax=Ereboglobus luteus TaxID=1796921 RepID=A0A2U8DZY7_9BACT|nr:metallophosphoesterase [Ereboglobus luteus]AWI08158.1 hypothetical protein CKA38_01765 [Ereboglobus luteus]
MKTKPSIILPLILALATAAPALATPLVDANFEGRLPPRIAFAFNPKHSIDTTRAHTGKSSLRIESTADWGGSAFFSLSNMMDFTTDLEFSVWVFVEKDAMVDIYVSADVGEGVGRQSILNVGSHIKPGEWNLVRGVLRASDWHPADRDVSLNFKVKGVAWFDDLSVNIGDLSGLPGDVWPKVETAVNKAAARRVTALAPGAAVTLDARNAAFLSDTVSTDIAAPSSPGTIIPAEGMLVFAVDAREDINVTGSVQLEPDADLRPGLRAYVLADDTIVAAPNIATATPWRATYTHGRPAAAPEVRGERPPAEIQLNKFRLSKGRHYIAVAGPHFRPAGLFKKLELRADAAPAQKPLHTFALLTDPHLGTGRFEWANTKIMGASAGELETTFRQLKRQGVEYAIVAGDMTDYGHSRQYKDFARAVKRGGLPVYACVGNHDTFSQKSREHIADFIPKLFPDGPEKTDYAFTRAPLRFIVLDGSWWRGKDGSVTDHRTGGRGTSLRDGALDWLRATLAADTKTPTIVVSHYEFYLARGVSSSGCDLGDPLLNKDVMDILEATPNVIATFNGHFHNNEVAVRNGIVCIQTPAFVEWPNAYRVFRVYADRVEWEMRQISNRGLIRESALPKHALFHMLSTHEGDLAGIIPLAPPAR